MSFTYTAGWLTGASSSSVSLMKIRYMVGDTDTRNQQILDEEIYYLLVGGPPLTYAAANAADGLAAKYAYQTNTENSELRVSAAARHKHFMNLADRLRKMGPGDLPGGSGDGVVLGEIYVGGAVKADVDTLSDNDAYVEPPFSVGMDDLGTGRDVDGFE